MNQGMCLTQKNCKALVARATLKRGPWWNSAGQGSARASQKLCWWSLCDATSVLLRETKCLILGWREIPDRGWNPQQMLLWGSLSISFFTPAEAGGCVPHQVTSPFTLHITTWCFPQFWIQIQIPLLADAEQNLCCTFLLVCGQASLGNSCLPSPAVLRSSRTHSENNSQVSSSNSLGLALQQSSTSNHGHVPCILEVFLETQLLHILLHLPQLSSVNQLHAPNSMTCWGQPFKSNM